MIVTFALVWIITILYSPQDKYNILNLQLNMFQGVGDSRAASSLQSGSH